jgi:hypothetical protein
LGLASTVVARERTTWMVSRRRAAGEGIGSGAESTQIECSCVRSSHRSRALMRVLRRKPMARAQVVLRKLVVRRHFALRVRVDVRVVGLALQCPQRADSAKLAHVGWSGRSGGHHPSPGTAQPLYAADGHLLPAVCAAGVNSIVALRSAVPASPCRV